MDPGALTFERYHSSLSRTVACLGKQASSLIFVFHTDLFPTVIMPQRPSRIDSLHQPFAMLTLVREPRSEQIPPAQMTRCQDVHI